MKISINQKLMSSFFILFLAVIAASVTGLINVNKVSRSGEIILEEKAPIKDVSMEAVIVAEKALNASRDYLLAQRDLEGIEEKIHEYLGDLDMFLAMVRHGTDSEAFKNSPAGAMYVKDGVTIRTPQGNPEMLALLDRISKDKSVFDESAREIIDLHKKKVLYYLSFEGQMSSLVEFLYKIDIQHRRWITALENAVEYEVDFTGATDPTQCFFGKWHAAFTIDDPEFNTLLEKFLPIHDKLHNSAKEILAAPEDQRESLLVRTMRYATKILPLLEKLERYTETTQRDIESREEVAVAAMLKASVNMTVHLEELEEIADNEILMARADADSAKAQAKTILQALMGGSFVVALLLGFLVRNAIQSIVGPVTRAIEGLKLTSNQMNNASEEIASASESLAEGTSEQAASLEETSASLEQMSSQTNQNSENASQADTVMQETKEIIATANDSMLQLTVAMDEITAASEETSKINKTIDEIAFQTNLLALNAAVEAARAGDAGAGFAVVAEEVRSLAMRSAVAASDTEELIETTMKKVTEGGNIVKQTNDEFQKVAASTETTGNLLGEINIASKEQARGIVQINTAIVEMDKVTQANASNAEQTASASQTMSAQAKELHEIIAELTVIIGKGKQKGQPERPSDTETDRKLLE